MRFDPGAGLLFCVAVGTTAQIENTAGFGVELLKRGSVSSVLCATSSVSP